MTMERERVTAPTLWDEVFDSQARSVSSAGSERRRPPVVVAGGGDGEATKAAERTAEKAKRDDEIDGAYEQVECPCGGIANAYVRRGYGGETERGVVLCGRCGAFAVGDEIEVGVARARAMVIDAKLRFEELCRRVEWGGGSGVG